LHVAAGGISAFTTGNLDVAARTGHSLASRKDNVTASPCAPARLASANVHVATHTYCIRSLASNDLHITTGRASTRRKPGGNAHVAARCGAPVTNLQADRAAAASRRATGPEANITADTRAAPVRRKHSDGTA
jgi:hypothetical protein